MDAVNVPKAVEFVMKCMNFDGGFGRVPESESHAGQVRRERERECMRERESMRGLLEGRTHMSGAVSHTDGIRGILY